MRGPSADGREPSTQLGEMLAVDRANVWRSTSLRRGLYVLGFLPGLVAALVGIRWVDLPLLPALVAAGAGMLFGVNAFCLDASGALWLASLPATPRSTFLVRTITVLEVALVTVAIAVLAGSLRAEGTTALLATVSCAVSALIWVTATCMRLSITRPHRAELRDARDTPAPPGAMAVYSVRLAVGHHRYRYGLPSRGTFGRPRPAGVCSWSPSGCGRCAPS